MARNRQRAKERQARRKAGNGQSDQPPESEGIIPAPEPASAPPEDAPAREEELGLREQVDLEVGAPPEELGRSDEVLEDEPDLEDEDHYDPTEDRPEEDDDLPAGPRGTRGGDPAEHKDRSRLVQFLFAVRAELARVQWPDRQTLVTLTGVVLGFVLIAGGYLGLLDSIFSRLIQALL